MTPAEAIIFPDVLFREQGLQWSLAGALGSPGQTVSGAYPIVRLDGGGLWRCDLSSIAITDAALRRTWRAVEGLLDGGSMPCVVPIAPRCSGATVPHDDETPFSDETEYAQPDIVALAHVAAALRATTLQVLVQDGDISEKEFFSVYHAEQGWRLYRIKTFADLGGGLVDLTFGPPLREAVAVDDFIEFDQPRCTMRLAAPGAMDMRLEGRRFGQPSASFVETFLA